MDGYLVGLDLRGQRVGRRAVLAQVQIVRVALKTAAPTRVQLRGWKVWSAYGRGALVGEDLV